MAGVHVKIDFRKFVNFIKQTEKGVLASTQDESLRKLIYKDIANSNVLFVRGIDSGASEASLDAVQRGRTISGKGFKTKDGKTRYAYGSIEYEGIKLNPIDEYGREYGEFSIADYSDEYHLEFGRSSNQYDMYNEVYKIIRNHILKGD